MTQPDGPAEERALDCALGHFQEAAGRLHLDDGMREILTRCKRELTVNFPVKMDNGSLQIFTGYRVHHNDTRGPVKGGLRYSPGVSMDEVRALAMVRLHGRRRRRSLLNETAHSIPCGPTRR